MPKNKLKPRRYTCHTIYRISSIQKASVRKNDEGKVYLYFPIEASASMRSKMQKSMKKQIEKLEKELQDALETILRECTTQRTYIRRRKSRSARTRRTHWMNRSVYDITQYKNVETKTLSVTRLMEYMERVIDNMLFCKRYASWYRIGPPNRLAFSKEFDFC